MTNNYRDELITILDKSKNIAVITHKSPDGDAIGSAMAFYFWLQKTYSHKNFDLFIEGTGSPSFANVFGYEHIIWVPDVVSVLTNYDTVVFLDLYSSSMVSFNEGGLKEVLNDKRLIYIDHHRGSPEKSDLFISKHLCSACQVLADLVFTQDTDLDEVIAKALLLGIMTDSGGFRYVGSNDTTVFTTVPRLLAYAKIAQLDELLMSIEEMPEKAFNLVKVLMQNTRNIKLSSVPGLTMSYILPTDVTELTEEEIRHFRGIYQTLVIRKIQNFPWGLIISPKETHFSLSFRSLPSGPDVNALCRDYFSGGGHIRAAGGRYPGTGMDLDMTKITESDMKDIIDNILNIIKNAKITFS